MDTCRPHPAECAPHIIGYKRVVLVDSDIERIASPGLFVTLVGRLQGGCGPCRKVLLRVAKGPLCRCDQLESRSICVDVGELVHLLAVKLKIGLLYAEEIPTKEDRLRGTDIRPLSNGVDKRLAIAILAGSDCCHCSIKGVVPVCGELLYRNPIECIGCQRLGWLLRRKEVVVVHSGGILGLEDNGSALPRSCGVDISPLSCCMGGRGGQSSNAGEWGAGKSGSRGRIDEVSLAYGDLSLSP